MPTAAETTFPAEHGWRKIGPIGLVVGLILVAGGFAMDGSDHHGDFYFSYLVAFMYAATLGLGALFFTLVQHAGRAGWSVLWTGTGFRSGRCIRLRWRVADDEGGDRAAETLLEAFRELGYMVTKKLGRRPVDRSVFRSCERIA